MVAWANANSVDTEVLLRTQVRASRRGTPQDLSIGDYSAILPDTPGSTGALQERIEDTSGVNGVIAGMRRLIEE